jgi:hypothetical protein
MQTLKALPNWITWKLLQNEGDKKPRKVPFYVNGRPRTKQGTPEDRAQLVTYDEARAVSDKVGFCTFSDTGVIALDFDHVVMGGVVQPDVLALVQGTYAEISPSGTGVRAFMSGTLASRKDTKGTPFAVEFFGSNGFVTVTGDELESTMFNEVTPISQAVYDLYRERFGNVPQLGSAANTGAEDDNDAWMLNAKPRMQWSLDELRTMLADCPSDVDRDTWLKVLMSVHHEFDGADAALDVCVEWSAKASNFSSRKDVEDRWNSFQKGGNNPLTGKWLVNHRKQYVVEQKYDRVDQWKAKIMAEPSRANLQEKLCAEIRRDSDLNDIDRQILAACLQTALQDVHDAGRMPIAACRKLLTPDKVKYEQRAVSVADPMGHYPEWMQGIVYVTDMDKYLDTTANAWLSAQSFNVKFNRMLTPSDDSTKNAHWAASNELQVVTCAHVMYAPAFDLLFQSNGSTYVNSYRHTNVPKAATVFDDEGMAAVEVWKLHALNVCSRNPLYTRILLSFIAHCVQFPGKKIRWAPLIKGIEGDGKSLFGALFAAVMGVKNVKHISPGMMAPPFNGWAEGGCVGMLEELKMTGHNRHDMLNSLKDLISNDHFPLHKKGHDPYDVLNTMNYFATTNFMDALPISDTSRRWFVLATPFACVEDMKAVYGANTDAYFERLVEATTTQAGALRKWLLEYTLADEFRADGRAYDTDAKSHMVSASRSDVDAILLEILAAGGVGLTPTVFASTYLSNALLSSEISSSLKTSSMHAALVRLGFVKDSVRRKWNGKPNFIWTFGSVPAWENGLKEILNKTISTEVDLFS